MTQRPAAINNAGSRWSLAVAPVVIALGSCVALVGFGLGGASLSSAADEAKPGRPLPELIAALSNDTVQTRRDAALALCKLDREAKKQALPALIERIKGDKDPQTRMAVCDMLTELGPDAADAIPALVNAVRKDFGGMGAEENHGRFRAAWALAAIGPAAVEPLREALTDRRPRVRSEAAMVFGRIGPASAPAIPDLIAVLPDGDAEVRKEASRSLAKIGSAAEAALITASQDMNHVVRTGAVAALGASIQPSDASKAAVDARLGDESSAVRASAIKAAAELKFPAEKLLPAFAAALAQDNEDLRLAVVNVLVADRELLTQAAPDLRTLLTNEQEGVSRHAAYLLQCVGPPAAGALIEGLRDERARPEQIADALGALGVRILEPLTAAMGDQLPRVRRGAALAMGRVRPASKETIELLTAALADPAAEVQQGALDSLGRLGPQARASLEAVRGMLAREAPETRVQAIEALFRIHPRDDQLLSEYVALLNDVDPRVQQQAIESTRRLGPLARKALTPVMERIPSFTPEVRLAAIGFVGSLGRSASEAVGALKPLLTDADPNIRAVVADTLGQVGSAAQPALPEIVLLLDDAEVKVRAAAAGALGGLDLEPDAARPHIVKGLKDGEAEVRYAAMAAIRKFRRRGTVFIPDLIPLAANDSNQRWLRETLSQFERSGPDAKSIPELIALLDHENAAVKLRTIDMLAFAGTSGKDAIERLEKFAEDENMELRRRSKTAIDRIKSGRRGKGDNN